MGCTTSGVARVLLRRAQIAPGLDVTTLDSGFGVGLAAGSMEAVGLRLEGSGLRVAETVRVKTSSVVNHVAAVPGPADEGAGLDVRADQGDARTVAIADPRHAFRVVTHDGAISALVDDARGSRAHLVWAVPTPRPVSTNGVPAVSLSEAVRAIGRDDGGAVVALRRPGALWVGVMDAKLAAAGPMVTLARKGATVGTPSLSTWGGGGAVAWAERPAGERDWSVVVATLRPTARPVRDGSATFASSARASRLHSPSSPTAICSSPTRRARPARTVSSRSAWIAPSRPAPSRSWCRPSR
jgi:hypothetical protein